ncbi:MAG: ferric reductase-like transmembrane domain-containing protein [Pseudomonadota bacterium]
MRDGAKRPVRALLVWGALAAAVLVPLALSAASPFLQWRGPFYIAAGFAGVIALGLLFVQPLLMSVRVPGLSALQARHVHRWVGGALVAMVVVHVAGLWVASPPDVVDALLFRSPTPFSAWGVIAMWAVFATAALALIRRPVRLKPATWRIVHTALAVVIAVGTAVHAVLIEGTMEVISKFALCALVLIATAKVAADLWSWRQRMAGNARRSRETPASPSSR